LQRKGKAVLRIAGNRKDRHSKAKEETSAARERLYTDSKGSQRNSSAMLGTGKAKSNTEKRNKNRKETKQMKTMEVRITFFEEVLGTSPADEDIYRNFIGSKAPDAASVEEEIEALGADAVAEKGMTVFARTEEGKPALYDYHFKGFFKDTCSMLARVKGSESSKMVAYKKEIDGLIFVNPRLVELEIPEGKTMGVCQRPLRASTALGERVALAMSESVPAGTSCVLEITTLIENSGTKVRKKKVKTKNEAGEIVEDTVEVESGGVDYMKMIREWLDYGKLRGIGQWRNSGKGRFTWEELRCW